MKKGRKNVFKKDSVYVSIVKLIEITSSGNTIGKLKQKWEPVQAKVFQHPRGQGYRGQHCQDDNHISFSHLILKTKKLKMSY